jgi:lipid-A-disaccharide synthase
MKVFVSAGEVSGDIHGSYLVKELKKLRPDIQLYGIGSERMAAAGVDVRFDISRRGSIGIFEALPNLFPILSVFNRVKKLLRDEKPDLVLLIDSQGFNLPLARFCKGQGIKTVYYIAPQEWLWGTPEGVKKVASTVDLIVAIFENEYQAYRQAGANVVYFGHPLIDIVKPTVSREAIRNQPVQPLIALCPGSRIQEIRGLLPVLLKAGEIIHKEVPQARFVIPVASSKVIKDIFDLVGDFRPDTIVGETYNILNASDLAICTSGTINLEASILGVPNIMVYKLSFLTYLIGKYIVKLDRKLPYFSMPNLLLNEKVIPELVMGNATPEKIAAEALCILRSKERVKRMKERFQLLRDHLGKPGVIRSVAESILSA